MSPSSVPSRRTSSRRGLCASSTSIRRSRTYTGAPYNQQHAMSRTGHASAVVAAEGHLIDSQLLTAIFDTVINRGAAFEVQAFDIGRTNDEFSRLTLKVSAPDQQALASLLEALLPLGCH